MANKKRIQERLEAEQKERQTRYIQIAGAAVVILIVTLGLIYAVNNQPAEEVPQEVVPTPIVEDPSSAAEEAPAAVQPSMKQYAAPPAMTIDTSKKYFAKFILAKGEEFTVELYADKAPITVNNFVFLARDGYYDGTTFHRVLEGFMAQGGDPTGTGAGGPGYQFEDEFSPDLRFDGEGILAMANSGPGTNGSQFFITYAATDWLNDMHTIFGRVTEGMDVVRGLTLRDPNAAPSYLGDAIETIEITEE